MGSQIVRDFCALGSHLSVTFGSLGIKPLSIIFRSSLILSGFVSSTHAVQRLGLCPFFQWCVLFTSSIASDRFRSETSVSYKFPTLFKGLPPLSITGFPTPEGVLTRSLNAYLYHGVRDCLCPYQKDRKWLAKPILRN